jgi:hypothetical protein
MEQVRAMTEMVWQGTWKALKKYPLIEMKGYCRLSAGFEADIHFPWTIKPS